MSRIFMSVIFMSVIFSAPVLMLSMIESMLDGFVQKCDHNYVDSTLTTVCIGLDAQDHTSEIGLCQTALLT